MARIVVVGSINIDFIVGVAELPKPNETLIGSDLRLAVGGKGLNQAVACARLSAETHMVAATGDDSFGDMARQHLAANGVKTDHVSALQGVPGGTASIVVAPDGQNMIVVSPGANARLTPDRIEAARGLIASADAVIVQHEIPRATTRRALEIARAHGVLSVLNPAPVDLAARDLFPLADVITPNETELAKLTGIVGQDDASLAVALGQLGAKQALVTLGANGCAALSEGQLARLPAFAVEAVDATGAGDVFNGALAVRLVAGDSLTDAMRFASAAAALSVTKPSADSAPTHDEVAAFLRALP